MSCPDPLPRLHAKALRYKTSKRAIARYLNGDIEWDHRDLKSTRDRIRKDLRDSQNQCCYYCRRFVRLERRNVGEAIEHFLDKSKPSYRKWGFHPLNLVLSCQPCNIVKSTKDLGDQAVKSAKFISANSGNYLWPHPYFDSYNENIKIAPGPVYSALVGAPRFNQARKMIDDLKLAEIPNIDDRALMAAKEIQRLQNKLFILAATPPGMPSKRRPEVLAEIKARLDKFMFEVFGL